MKKALIRILGFAAAVSLAACGAQQAAKPDNTPVNPEEPGESGNATQELTPQERRPDASTEPERAESELLAVVTALQGNTMLVRPVDGSDELKSSDSFSVGLSYITDDSYPSVGDTCKIVYSGGILETYPARLEGIESVTVVSAAEPAQEPKYRIAWVNYSDDPKLYRNSLNGPMMAISSVRHLPIFLATSEEALARFRADFEDSLSFSAGYDGPSFDEISSEYDGAFFSERDLALVYVAASSGSFRFGVDDIVIRRSASGDYSCCVMVEQTNSPEIFTADMAGWLILVELEKPDSGANASYDAILGQSIGE